jgi:hypothetical protein
VTETADIVSVLQPIMEQQELFAREPDRDILPDDGEPADDERARIVSLLGPSWCAWFCWNSKSPAGLSATVAGSCRWFSEGHANTLWPPIAKTPRIVPRVTSSHSVRSVTCP